MGLPDPPLMYHQYPFRLSGGQRQRVMIAMALALEPAILIADEPTTALDVTTQAQILQLIRDIQRRKGMSVMFITHDFGVVAEIADSVVVMEKGHCVEQGSAEQVLKSPSHLYTRRLIAAVPHLTGKDRVPAQAAVKSSMLKVEYLVKTYRSGSALVRQAADRTRSQRRVVRPFAGTHPGRSWRKRLRQIIARAIIDQAPRQRQRLYPVRGTRRCPAFRSRVSAASAKDPDDLPGSVCLAQSAIDGRANSDGWSDRAWSSSQGGM